MPDDIVMRINKNNSHITRYVRYSLQHKHCLHILFTKNCLQNHTK